MVFAWLKQVKIYIFFNFHVIILQDLSLFLGRNKTF